MKNNIFGFKKFRDGAPKRTKRRNADGIANIYCDPANNNNLSRCMLVIGLIARTLIVYLGILGLTCFVCGAAGLTKAAYWQAVRVTPWAIALMSLIPAAACGISSVSRRLGVATLIAYPSLYCAIIAVLFGDPFKFTVSSFLRVYNYALYTVSSYGYYSLGNYMISDGYDYSSAAYATSDPERFVGVFLICTLIGIVLRLTVQKKVRLTMLVLFVAATVSPILTYNIAIGTSGIGFLIVFSCSVIALKIYDRRYSGKIEKSASKRQERAKAKAAKKAESIKKAEAEKELINDADKVFEAALDADAGYRKAKAARKAFLKAKRSAVNKRKKAEKNKLRLEKARQKDALKKEKQASSARLREIAQLRRNKDIEGARAAKKALKEESKQKKLKLKSARELEKAQKRQKQKEADRAARHTSWAGGYAAIGVALVAMLAVIVPMTTVKSPFKIIDPINNKVQTARIYVTAYLKGNDVDLNELYAYGADDLTPRQLSFDPLEYKGNKIFRVETDGSANVYLRSWIGTEFVWDEQKWVSADYDTVLNYRDRFGSDFSPDEITTAFYRYAFPSSSDITDSNTYKNFSKYGFTEQQVNLWRVSGSSLLLFTPSHMNTDVGLLDYGALDAAPYKYSKYFDGVYSSRFYKKGMGYGTVSFIPYYGRANVGEALENTVEYYQRCKQFIQDNKNASDCDVLDYLLYTFDTKLQGDGIEYMGTNLCDRYFSDMTDEEKDRLFESFATEADYSLYVHENYTQKTHSAVIEAIADEIRSDIGDAGIFDTVMAVADYLKENCTYTETPNADKYYGDIPVLEAFLTDVKEGYCSHFATAACAILREFNIPVRYVEGYVASGFEPAFGGRTASMRTYVTDDCAHAWIEVYISCMGWTQFEVTPGDYSEAMYNPSGATVVIDPETNEAVDPDADTPPKFDPDKEPDIDFSSETVDENETDIVWFLKRIAIGAAVAAIIALIAFIIRIINKRAQIAVGNRYRVIDLARNEEIYSQGNMDNRKTARQINDYILEVFEIIGASPKCGELSSEYARRIMNDYKTLSLIDADKVIEAIQKEEFGHGLSFEEMSMCAEYLSDIISSVYNSLSLWQKINLRYIKHKI